MKNVIKKIVQLHAQWCAWCGNTEWKPFLTAVVLASIFIGLCETSIYLLK